MDNKKTSIVLFFLYLLFSGTGNAPKNDRGRDIPSLRGLDVLAQSPDATNIDDPNQGSGKEMSEKKGVSPQKGTALLRSRQHIAGKESKNAQIAQEKIKPPIKRPGPVVGRVDQFVQINLPDAKQVFSPPFSAGEIQKWIPIGTGAKELEILKKRIKSGHIPSVGTVGQILNISGRVLGTKGKQTLVSALEHILDKLNPGWREKMQGRSLSVDAKKQKAIKPYPRLGFFEPNKKWLWAKIISPKGGTKPSLGPARKSSYYGYYSPSKETRYDKRIKKYEQTAEKDEAKDEAKDEDIKKEYDELVSAGEEVKKNDLDSIERLKKNKELLLKVLRYWVPKKTAPSDQREAQKKEALIRIEKNIEEFEEIIKNRMKQIDKMNELIKVNLEKNTEIKEIKTKSTIELQNMADILSEAQKRDLAALEAIKKLDKHIEGSKSELISKSKIEMQKIKEKNTPKTFIQNIDDKKPSSKMSHVDKKNKQPPHKQDTSINDQDVDNMLPMLQSKIKLGINDQEMDDMLPMLQSKIIPG